MTISKYEKIPPAKLRKECASTIEKLTAWFEQNPKRRVCRAQLWYGSSCKVRRGHIKEDVTALVELLIKQDASSPQKFRGVIGTVR